jgi:hypothetical protein
MPARRDRIRSTKLRRLVERERVNKCENSRRQIRATLPARDRICRELRLRIQPHSRATFRFGNRLSEFICHRPQ